MDTYGSVLWIVGGLFSILIIGAFRSKIEWVINFVLRGALGMLLIYFANYFLSGQIAGIGIGYNPVTFLVSGFLGFPGVAMMFGINLYMVL